MDPAQAYTATGAYMTLNTTISIASQANNVLAQNSCPVPSGVKFWWLSTRTHRFAVSAKASDGATDLVTTLDWEHPSIARFAAPAFHAFAGALTATCRYDNLTNATVAFGDSETTDETCMAIGYFFPAATGGQYCVNSIGPL